MYSGGRINIIRQIKHSNQIRSLLTSSKSKIEEKQNNMLLNDCKNQTVLITGAANGIGLEIVKELLKNGIASGVTMVDSDKQEGEDNCKQLSEKYGKEKVLFFNADVADSRQIDKAFKSTVNHFNAVNMVINNAGILNDITWEREIKTNLYGNVIGTLLGMQYMSKSASGRGGIIVNIASIMGIIPSAGFPIHTLTQFGIIGFTKALATNNLYDRTGVKIIALCPGLTNTKMLQDAKSRTINDNFAAEFQDEIDGCEVQPAANVAKGLLSILNLSSNGSLWLVESNRTPHEIHYPDIEDFQQKLIKV